MEPCANGNCTAMFTTLQLPPAGGEDGVELGVRGLVAGPPLAEGGGGGAGLSPRPPPGFWQQLYDRSAAPTTWTTVIVIFRHGTNRPVWACLGLFGP